MASVQPAGCQVSGHVGVPMSDRDSPLFPPRSDATGTAGNRPCLAKTALLRTPNLLIIPSAIDPPAREAGQAARVQMEGPYWTNDLDVAAWSAGLARVDGGRDDQPRSSRS